MKKELIFGLLFVVLVGGFLFFQSQKSYQKVDVKNNQQLQNANNSQNQLIESKKSGFSLEDLALHNNPKDCWLLIDGKIYDVTNYINLHPGGKVMAKFCGQDATEAFNTKGKKNKPHKPEAYDILKNLYIGDLK